MYCSRVHTRYNADAGVGGAGLRSGRRRPLMESDPHDRTLSVVPVLTRLLRPPASRGIPQPRGAPGTARPAHARCCSTRVHDMHPPHLCRKSATLLVPLLSASGVLRGGWRQCPAATARAAHNARARQTVQARARRRARSAV
jgi:hypothetical protein